MFDEKELADIVRMFSTEGAVTGIRPLGPGYINDTFIVTTSGGPRYILQRKNHNVFPDIPGMMQNIDAVTSHLKKKVEEEGGDPLREAMTVIRRERDTMTPEQEQSMAGDLYFRDGRGNYWTMTLFIEGSVSYEKADTPELAYKGGLGIGKFQTRLADFTGRLNETIKGFHDIRWRFRQWDEAIARDAAGRAASVHEETAWIESRRKEMLDFWSLVETGTIPVRVTHNDTKISNILFDRENGDVLCAIDLDTCMSSTSLNDFGDAIRSYTNTGKEDDPDLTKVSMSIEMFRAYTRGYMHFRKDSLTDIEKEYLAFSARYITYEQVLRFLMDYIDGDTYYKTAYPEHNLVRARAQNRLLESIESQYGEMTAIVREYSK